MTQTQVANFANPQTLAGVSVGSIFLSVVSNCLMVPRALLTKDLIWLTGSSWCPLVRMRLHQGHHCLLCLRWADVLGLTWQLHMLCADGLGSAPLHVHREIRAGVSGVACA